MQNGNELEWQGGCERANELTNNWMKGRMNRNLEGSKSEVEAIRR